MVFSATEGDFPHDDQVKNQEVGQVLNQNPIPGSINRVLGRGHGRCLITLLRPDV